MGKATDLDGKGLEEVILAARVPALYTHCINTRATTQPALINIIHIPLSYWTAQRRVAAGDDFPVDAPIH